MSKPEIVAELYALQSQAGAIRSHFERLHQPLDADAMAEIQDKISGLIEGNRPRTDSKTGDLIRPLSSGLDTFRQLPPSDRD